jgi:MoaA/NifB/PqqE/SkfB family radical SAM enzyme
VLDGLAALRRIKARRGSSAPEVHVAYMLLRSGLDELDRLPGLLAGTGVTAVVVSTLDFVPCPAMAAETLIPADPAERDRLAARLDAMGADAAAAGLAVHYRLADPEADRRGCSENVARAVVVSAEGEVAPCVYLNLAVAGEIATGGLSGGAPYRRLSFGNVREADLADIWNSPDYVRFRRDVASGRLPAPCRGCLKPSLGL